MAHDRFKVRQNVGRGDPQREDTLKAKRLIAHQIPLRPVATVMRLAIDLNRQPGVGAEEIEHIRTERVLAAKLQPTRTRSQDTPEQHFRQRHLTTKVACPGDDFGPLRHEDCPSTMLRMVPLPAKLAGRISGVQLYGATSILPAIPRGGGPSAQPMVEGHL